MSARLSLRLPALLDDRALLSRFAADRDEAAFAALVKRHAAMVLGVCRRAVRDPHHAEDAFQATFLVLARNPTAAGTASSVGAWLHGVARRVGLSARRRLRRADPPLATSRPGAKPQAADSDFDDLLRVLDEEVARLPDECRAAVVARFLREQTQDDAARQLGWSLSTLRRRLDRAKELLRSRLSRRGATLSAAQLASSVASAAVPVPLLEAAARAGVSNAAPPAVLALAAPPRWHGKFVAAAVALLAGGFAFAPQSPPEVVPAPRVAEVPGWASLGGRVVLPKGMDVPPPREITGNIRDADHNRRNGPVIDEAVLIHPTNRGVRNAVVWLRPDSDDPKAAFPTGTIHPDLRTPKPRTREVVIECCQFEPRVIAARTGDRLLFKNKSHIMHNVAYINYPTTQGEWEFNVTVRPDAEYRPENALVPFRFASLFKCHIHTWMQGHVFTFDHPYSAVTDADGTFEIKSAPVGTWRLVVWHERTGFRDGKAGRLGHKLTIAAGAAPLTIPLDSDHWPKPE